MIASLPSPNLLRYGQEAPLSPQIPLRAGPVGMLFENGDLRYLQLGSQELVRRIYVAIRDRNWGTVKPDFSDLHIDSQPELLPPQEITHLQALNLSHLRADLFLDDLAYPTTLQQAVEASQAIGVPLYLGLHFSLESMAGSVFPVYHVFADLAEFRGAQVYATVSTEPQKVQGLALHQGKRTRLLVANLRAEPQWACSRV